MELNDRLFSVIFWFVLLGPAGALAFRFSSILHHRFKGETSGFGEAAARKFVSGGWRAIGTGRRGSLSVDDEGNPAQRTVLIEDGILQGYMQDRLNSGADERRPDRQRPPRIVRAHADAADDEHDHARGPARSRGDHRVGERWAVCRQFRRRPGRHHQRQVRVLGQRGLLGRERQDPVPGQGRDDHRQRPRGTELELNDHSFDPTSSRAGSTAREREYAQAAFDAGAPVAIGSDAHYALYVGRFDTAIAIDEEIKKIVNHGMKRAEKILTDNIEILHRLASALLEREILDAAEIDTVIRGEELPPLEKRGNGVKPKSEETPPPSPGIVVGPTGGDNPGSSK